MPHSTFAQILSNRFISIHRKSPKMKLLTPVILFSVGALAYSGWSIPRNHPDGVYRVTVNDYGVSKHVLLRDLSASTESALGNAVTSAAGLSKRENTGINEVKCRDYQLDAADANAAVDNLELQCGSGSFAKKDADYYATSNDVVAYICNYSNGPNVFYGSDVRDALENKISDICGDYVAGHDHVKARGYRIGYEKKDAKFCDGRGIEGKDDD